MSGLVRKGVLKSIWSYRRATWRSRSLPHFIVIGAQKAGTTSLFSYLAQHPHLFPSYRKEVHFFDGGLNPEVETYAFGRPWYQAHFPLRRQLHASAKTFEASPLYLFNPLTPRRIHKLLPDVKLIALLRNPAERTISHYFHEVRLGREARPIEQALTDQEDQLDQVVLTQDYKSDYFVNKSYKSRSMYKQQLDRYYEYFGKDQVLVLSSENFFAEPTAALGRIYDFLGVDPDFRMLDLTPRNVATNRTRVDRGVYDYLSGFFEPHNHELFELAGQKFDWNDSTSLRTAPSRH